MDKQTFTEILSFFTKTAQAKIYDKSGLKGKYKYPEVDTSNNFISKVYKKEDNIKHYKEIDASWFDKGLQCIRFYNGNSGFCAAYRYANFHIYNPDLKTDLAVEIGPDFSENKSLDNGKDDNYDTIRGYYVTLYETGYGKYKKRSSKQTKDYDKENQKVFAITDINDIYNYVNELLLKINQNMKQDSPFLNSAIELLKSNHNLIFSGAPGTGKTYLAKQIAKAMFFVSIRWIHLNPSNKNLNTKMVLILF
jgi:hypothetical protein